MYKKVAFPAVSGLYSQPMSDNNLRQYSLGPFHVDLDTASVRLEAGTYVLSEPVVFGLTDLVSGVVYAGLIDLHVAAKLSTVLTKEDS